MKVVVFGGGCGMPAHRRTRRHPRTAGDVRSAAQNSDLGFRQVRRPVSVISVLPARVDSVAAVGAHCDAVGASATCVELVGNHRMAFSNARQVLPGFRTFRDVKCDWAATACDFASSGQSQETFHDRGYPRLKQINHPRATGQVERLFWAGA